MSRYFLTGLIIFCAFWAYAQDTAPMKGRPDVPGTFMVEYGHSFSITDSVPFKVLGNRNANFYYLYDMPFGVSKFSFHAGAGFGLDRVKFTKNHDGRYLWLEERGDSAVFRSVSRALPDVQKSMFITNYVDVPLEFRFNTSPEDKSRNFFVAVGGRVGYMMRAQTKIKYIENTKVNRRKDQKPFHVTPVRYSAYIRVGVGAFNIYANYALSPLFKPNEGPTNKPIQLMTVGISLDLF